MSHVTYVTCVQVGKAWSEFVRAYDHPAEKTHARMHAGEQTHAHIDTPEKRHGYADFGVPRGLSQVFL